MDISPVNLKIVHTERQTIKAITMLMNASPVVGIINGVPVVVLKIFFTSSSRVFVNAGIAGER